MIVQIVRLYLDSRENFNLENTDMSKMLAEDRRMTYRQIEEILCLNVTNILSILKDQLHVIELCCLWMSRSLTEDNIVI